MPDIQISGISQTLALALTTLIETERADGESSKNTLQEVLDLFPVGSELSMLLASSTDDPTSGHGVIKGVVVINGTDEILDPNTLSVLWYVDYDGTGFTLANATGTLAGLKTDLEANLLLSSDVAMIRYVATEQAAYLGDMVNGFRYTQQ